MPFNVSEEQSLLSSMIAERDAQISTLTHQLHSTSEILHTTQKELQSKSASRRSQREEHSATIKKLKEEHSEQRRILAKFEQNVKNGGGLRVHEYAALMRSANSNQVESSYVIRLQAQLCRAMHSLGVMESQLALVKENCSSLIKFMKEDLSHMVDDRTRREIELMNGLAKVDNEKRVMAEEMESKIREKEELLDQVREEYEELGLEYDENEVKRALEVKYLLEQMEKVKEDKVRLERELLGALLEREEQINGLRSEAEGLGEKLAGLKKEAERREMIVEPEQQSDDDDNDDKNGNGSEGGDGESEGEDDERDTESKEDEGEEVAEKEEATDVNQEVDDNIADDKEEIEGQGDSTAEKDDTSNVISQVESATLDSEDGREEEAKEENEVDEEEDSKDKEDVSNVTSQMESATLDDEKPPVDVETSNISKDESMPDDNDDAGADGTDETEVIEEAEKQEEAGTEEKPLTNAASADSADASTSEDVDGGVKSSDDNAVEDAEPADQQEATTEDIDREELSGEGSEQQEEEDAVPTKKEDDKEIENDIVEGIDDATPAAVPAANDEPSIDDNAKDAIRDTDADVVSATSEGDAEEANKPKPETTLDD